MQLNRREALLFSASAMLFAATSRTVSAQVNGGTLRFAPHSALRVLDPVTTSAYITRNHGYLVYDTLFSVDSASVPQPQMVDNWEMAEDGLSWTFRLRDGLAFHDGAPVTSEDVIASIRRWWQRDVVGLRLKAATSDIVAIDDRSFRFELSGPFGVMLEALARTSSIPLFIMPRRIAELPPATMLEEVVGSGPYRFLPDEFRPGVSWSYSRNEAYVPRPEPADGLAGGKVPRVERIDTIWFPSPDTAISALLNNELDIIESVNPDRRASFDGTDVKLVRKGSPSASTIRFNWAQPPFDDVLLRRAVQKVVSQIDYLDVAVGDPDAYQECGAFFGCGTPLETDAGYGDNGLHNGDEARELVAQSGYNGEEIVIITPGDVASFSTLAPLTQQLLTSIGIKSRIETMEWSSFLERRSRTAPVSEGGWNLAHAVFDSIDLLSPLGNMNFDARGNQGYTGFVDDPETEQLKNRYQGEPDPAKQKEIAEEMQKRAHDLVFYIPLGTYYQYTAVRPEISNYVTAVLPALWSLDKA
ncbi:peptide/nickel transport system substrate-binding protein [Aquamicrobium lusatiense]|uniref:Peptide/nickel transport system substrate-binding protein n=1 Tax=Aquamicrobium lusatiense TaxID=89772 RepID=A0A7W9VXI5_9HYPH|nr:ABC transporter substrate-binding protein [Aquamicrobium lusatiense]MBB6014731.1 peptide/nickel transport system substrate-binding protein [Aquamicrobium lusatiense]